MHYVSWDRSDRDNPSLLAEGGPEVLAHFSHDHAVLNPGGDAEEWSLIQLPEAGAVAKRDDVEVVRTTDSLKRDKQIAVDIEGRGYVIVAETSKNFIIDDAHGDKVAQFTSDHNGVRRSILEFEGQTHLPLIDVVGLAWVSRLVLESRKMVNTTGLIALLLFLSVFIVAVWFLGP
ncbi:hypothetical protein [Corynebacterium aquatimens]|uniref:Uncharacterized protein n=1 Tax=Corynebacterium aquatimens TaxID=1190508 RepID=A0A931E401_9CORY|nr:hypothetical protein [Corynebacterium aquatimens]MBG6122073.1 hypothetical protein [Corynebacterium aquatimens]WJY65386.1 hypothetical protein CAQUA_03345 [Corynebacterium aquatimens]